MELKEILSIISLILSVISLIFSIKNQRKINKVNLNSQYYDEVFNKYLLTEIPQSANYIRFNNGKLTDFNKLTDTISDMQKSMVYFKYANKTFYDKLKRQLSDLEDYIGNLLNRTINDSEDQLKEINSIHDKIKEIYELIIDTRNGK